MPTPNQVIARLEALMRPMGDIDYETDTFFSVTSPHNVGAGVSIRSGSLRDRVYVKITVFHEDACNLINPPVAVPVVAGAMLTLSTPFAMEVRTIIKRNQPALVAWEPAEPVDEPLMQKCALFVREVFARADL
jgi:hypothetical protein